MSIILSRAAGAAVAALGAAALSAPVMAFNPMSWMNPGRWLGNEYGYHDYGYGAPGYYGGYPATGYAPGYPPGYGVPYGPGYPVAPYAPAPVPAPEPGQGRQTAGGKGRSAPAAGDDRGDVRTYPPRSWDGQGGAPEGGGHGWAPATAGGDGRGSTPDYWQREESRPEPRWGQERRSGYGIDRDPRPEWHGDGPEAADRRTGAPAARDRQGAPGHGGDGTAGRPGAGPVPRTVTEDRPATATGDEFVKRLDDPPLPPAAEGSAADWWNTPVPAAAGAGNGRTGGPGVHRRDERPSSGKWPEAPR